MNVSNMWSSDSFCVGTDGIIEALAYIASLVDDQFGEGYAAKNPALVGTLMQTARAQRTDHPLVGQTLSGISEALQAIAEALES